MEMNRKQALSYFNKCFENCSRCQYERNCAVVLDTFINGGICKYFRLRATRRINVDNTYFRSKKIV